MATPLPNQQAAQTIKAQLASLLAEIQAQPAKQDKVAA